MIERIGLVLDPLDLLFFRDGRPFEAGLRLGSTAIFPQTLTGAVRTALLDRAGCDFPALARSIEVGRSFGEALADQSVELADIAAISVRGPWFSRDGQPLLPAPAALLRDKNGPIVRLAPLKEMLPGWVPEEARMLPLWTRSSGRAERLSGYLTIKGMQQFLRGRVPDQAQIVELDKLVETEPRTGIAVSSGTMTVAEGMIYTADYLALKPTVSLYAELSGPAGTVTGAFAAGTAIPLGGQGRYVCIRRLQEPVQWPDEQDGAAGPLLVLTTPAPFPAGWRPNNLDLVAAAVPGHVAVSGWDMARGGPKPTRFAVAAGATYFCLRPPRYDERRSLCEGEDALIGWGSFLRGVWDYA